MHCIELITTVSQTIFPIKNKIVKFSPCEFNDMLTTSSQFEETFRYVNKENVDFCVSKIKEIFHTFYLLYTHNI